MQMKFVGYVAKYADKNPDGSYLYGENGVYISPDGIECCAYFLLEVGCQPGLGDNPEVPTEAEHWFIKKQNAWVSDT